MIWRPGAAFQTFTFVVTIAISHQTSTPTCISTVSPAVATTTTFYFDAVHGWHRRASRTAICSFRRDPPAQAQRRKAIWLPDIGVGHLGIQVVRLRFGSRGLMPEEGAKVVIARLKFDHQAIL